MSDDAGLAALERELAALLACLSPGARARFLRAAGKQLRDNQQMRIAAQQNPDGSAYTPRRPQVDDKTHKLRRSRARMFAKLSKTRWMAVRTTADSATIQFVAGAGRLANIHQHGLRDRVNKYGLQVQYPARQLLGFSDADIEMVREMLLAAVGL